MATGLRQSTNCVYCRNPKPDHEVTCPDQRECFLLFDCAVRDRAQNLRIHASKPSKLLRIGVVALTIAVRYRSHLTHVRHDDFMAEFLQLLADPDRMRSRLHGYACWRQIGEPLLNGLVPGPEATSANDVSTFVERAVVAPDIS